MGNRYTRREVLGLVGAGAAVLGASGLANSATKNEATPGQQEEHAMTPLKKFNKYGEDLEYHLMLRTSPIAVKMLKSESDNPEGAFRPKKDRGYHFAQCRPLLCPAGTGSR